MARLRLGKAAAAAPTGAKRGKTDGKGNAGGVAKTKKTGAKGKAKHDDPDADELLAGVRALGGTRDDYELVRRAREGEGDAGPGPDDPALAADVSRFLRGLGTPADDGAAAEATKTSAVRSAEEEPRRRHKGDRSKKGKAPPAEAAPAPAPAPRAKKDTGKADKSTLDAGEAAPQKKKNAGKADPAPASAPKTKTKTKLEPTTPAPAPAPLPAALATKPTPGTPARLLIPPQSHWYAALPPLPPAAPPLPSAAQLAALAARAAALHAADVRAFAAPAGASSAAASEAAFLAKIIAGGTLSDRLSALTLRVQASPVHGAAALETLRAMAERRGGGRGEGLGALRCVVDWWVGGGAPPRKLRYFRDQPLLHPGATDAHLLLWHFEDWLKKYFFGVLQILEGLSLDPLPYVRTQALTLIATLLREAPEQEQNLLRLLANKLGDTERALCARASHHLLQLLQAHPAMKAVVVREVAALVLRPAAPAAAAAAAGTAPGTGKGKGRGAAKGPPPAKAGGGAHVRYYAMITFNQIVLAAGDTAVARQLVDVYFEMFKELLGAGAGADADADADADGEKGGEKGDDGTREVRMDKAGRVRDGARDKRKRRAGETAGVAGAAGFAEAEDAHAKLLSALLTGVNRALPFAKLAPDDPALQRHLATLFRISHTSTFATSLQALVLIQHLAAALPPRAAAPVAARYARALYATLHDARLARAAQQAMYLNLLFKSLKADPERARVRAFVRRFVQVLASGAGGAPEFAAGGLYLLGELFGTVPGLRTMLDPADADAGAHGEPYDPRKRDPQHAHAGASPLWELTLLAHHYHPAVALHARQLLARAPLTARAELAPHTLGAFLERFVFRNAKRAAGAARGASAMQPAAGGAGAGAGGVTLVRGAGAGAGPGVDAGAFARRGEGEVPVEEVFFHRFFARKGAREKARAKARGRGAGSEEGSDAEDDADGGEDEDDGAEEDDGAGAGAPAAAEDDADESGSDDAEEAEIWKAMQASMLRVAGDDELLDESDGLPSDLDDDVDLGDDEDIEDADSDDAAGNGSDADLSLAEGSDADDLLPLDGLIEYDGSDAGASDGEEEEWGGITDGGAGEKRKRTGTDKEARKRRRALPTFASYEEYAKMIEEGPEDDI